MIFVVKCITYAPFIYICSIHDGDGDGDEDGDRDREKERDIQ